MADLLDIAPATAVEVVKVDGKDILVRGLNSNAIASIVARYPKVRSIVSGGGDGDFITRLIIGCGSSIGPIIAAGCDHLEDERYEQLAANLLLEYQLEFLNAIFWLTFPNGIGAFLKTLSRLKGSPVPANNLKVRLKPSPSTSPPSSDADSPPIMQ